MDTATEEYLDDRRVVPDLPVDESTRDQIRHRYPTAAFRGPLFEGRDRIALAMATLMLIGPLAAMPLGLAG